MIYAGFLLVLATACGTTQQPQTLPPAAPAGAGSPIDSVSPSELEAACIAQSQANAAEQAQAEQIYEQLSIDVQSYEDGVERLAEGDEVAGEAQIHTATRSIGERFETCRNLPGCDLNRFFYAFEQILSRKSLALKLQAGTIAEMQAAAAAPELIEESAANSPALVEGEPVATNSGGTIERGPSLLRGAEFTEIIELNRPVKAAIDDWLTWMRPQLMQTWENYQFLRSEIRPVYEEAGLPEALLFGMIATETNGKVHATSRAGARGLLQFMRYTGKKYGLSESNGFDQRFDPVMATQANVAYLNDLFGMFNENLEKALASYNGGEGRVGRLNRLHRGASIWDREFYYSLPRETRDYVPRILAASWLFLHPEDYNLEFPPIPQDRVALVLERDASLSELTVCLGQSPSTPNGWFRTLRNLNPRIDPSDRMVAGTTVILPEPAAVAYKADCVGSDALLARAQEIHAANYPDKDEAISYVVRRGDTLSKIAGRHRCVSMRELASINRVRGPKYIISVGQRLQIPDCG